jgi:tetratricopeptide (TPR) repeat protein
VIAVAPSDVDVGRFELLLEQARNAAGAGDRHTEAAVLRRALALWRGEPLVDVPSETLHRDTVARLAEQRLDAVHRRVEADLALGRHAELVAELRVMTDRHPVWEQFWAQLMTALYRCGRQADALEAYQRVSRLLADELGVDPGPALQALHQAILVNDSTLAVPPSSVQHDAWVRPSQLPVDVADFVGRADLVRHVRLLFADDRRVPIVALSGSPGVGKTALAVHAAHRLADRFLHGQLYVNLHGATSGLRPLQPLEILGRFLRALGIEADAIPAELEEASAALRSRVAGRRLLVVLDNAASAAQVTPLLLASPGCGVLVTSRVVLTDLDGAKHLSLDVLPASEAVELLSRLAGRERVAAEPAAAADVARYCGYLPLALRIAGARLAARPGWPVDELAKRLDGAQHRLDELQLAEVGVRASFEMSYQQLSDSTDALDRAAAETFGILGLPDGSTVSVPVAARLLDGPENTAERLLERLVDAQLLETPTPCRYRLHDLLRLYARELARQRHPEPERGAALTRAIGFYVASAWQTMALLRPGDYRLARADDRWRSGGLEFADQQDALEWLEAERANLLAAVRQAVVTPGVPAKIGIQLAQALFGFFWVHSHRADWVQANKIALGVARQIGDLTAQAQAHNDLGAVYYRQGRYDQALVRLNESLIIRRELGDRTGQALSLGNLGNVYQWQGRYKEALACLQESLAIRRSMADRWGQAHSLGNLGIVYERQTRHGPALACLRESVAIFRELGDCRGEAASLRNLGVTLRALGRLEEARTLWLEALAIFEQLQTADADEIGTLLADLPDNASL